MVSDERGAERVPPIMTDTVLPIPMPTLTMAEVVEKIPAINANYTSCQAKFKINYQDENQNLSAQLNAKLLQGQRVHILITGPFGIVVAELIARPDSFFVENRLQREFTTGATSRLAQYAPIPIDYATLEMLLTGLPVALKTAQPISADSGHVQLLRDNNLIKAHYSSRKLSQLEMRTDGQIAFVDYNDYRADATIGHQIPWLRKLRQGPENGRENFALTMEAQKINFNSAIEIPTSLIPGRGYKVNIIRN